MRVAFQIGNHDIRLVALEGDQVVKWGTLPLEAGLVTDGHIVQPQAVATAIESLVKSLKMTVSSASATLSGLSFTYRSVRLPKMKADQMGEAVMRAARKEIPLPLESLYISWQLTEVSEEEVEVFLLGVPRTFIDALVQTMKFAGIRLEAIDLKALALARAAARPGALIVDFEDDCFDIIVISDGIPAVLHTVSPRAAGTTTEDSVRRLTDELSRTINFYNITHANNPLPSDTPLLLSGSLGTDDAVRRLIQASIEFSIEPLVPQVKFAPDFPAALYVSGIGMNVKPPVRTSVSRAEAGRFHDINLNILTGKYQSEKHKVPPLERLLPVVLIAAVVLLISLVMVRMGSRSETTRLTEQVDRLNRELRLTRLRLDEAAQTETVIKNLQDETTSLLMQQQLLKGNGVSPAVALSTITNAAQNNAAITSIDLNNEDITIDGLTDTRAGVIAYAFELQDREQFAEVRIALIEENEGGFNFSIVVTR